MGGSRAATEGRGGAQAAGGDAGGGAAAAGGAAQAAGRNGGGAQAAGAEVLLVQAADARGLQRHMRRTQQPILPECALLSLPFPSRAHSPRPRHHCRRNRTAAPSGTGPARCLIPTAAACVVAPAVRKWRPPKRGPFAGWRW